MQTMEIYEPAMCCSTGLCGVGVNPELLRMAATLQNLKDNGIVVARYNLSSAPSAFMRNAEVAAEISNTGTDMLPLIVVGGKIVIKKRYPTGDEIAKLLGVPLEVLNKKKATCNGGGCNCGDGGCC